MVERLKRYGALIRFDRPIGTLLLMWPALWALWLAGKGSPSWDVVVIFALGTFLMRSAGCAINDYADRHIDGHVKRTSNRPIATGLVSPREALAVFAFLSLAAFGLVLLLNWQTVVLSFVALALAAIYPFMKRYTHLPQLVLGMAFAWAVPMAYMALTENVPPNAWLLYIAAVIWALVYDTQYAMVDREDDLKIGVKSTAILFGEYDIVMILLLQLSMLGLMVLIGVKEELSLFYYLGLAAATLLAVYQQILIRKREPAGCFKAFLNNNYFGMVIFAGLLAHYLVTLNPS
ncbi:4-hydroxybenzoate polyprenyltransferase [Solemya velesiana gill symbiont]|uniref:4-hydroxybenzoate octaprenyltransferase n=2 Tax=Solemya velesiana gill symbiont TaxID=1918948 RepID=A0A1T2KXA5_9GAMM|nr:4-hydroxybenzoate polyprenyltransferase [Solemya velesiana gill symbiont]